MKANEVSMPLLRSGVPILEALQRGVMAVESDPSCTSVGLGGLPDREGKVTLDACLMDHSGRCGGVAFLQDIENPIAVARMVMEKTPHVLLAGEGAQRFALAQGFERKNLLTEDAEKKWKKWLETSNYTPEINIENHDTIGSVGIDSDGKMGGVCTTSGLAWKMHGRVGDSPLIGSGLFIDGGVGCAAATGHGEEVVRVSGSSMVVEAMRRGRTPQQACEEIVLRIKKMARHPSKVQVGFIAINRDGEHGAFSLQEGFNFALSLAEGEPTLVESKFDH